MNLTLTKHKLLHKLFGTPVPMATLKWNNSKRVDERREMIRSVLSGLGLVALMLLLGSGDSLMELFFTFIGI